MDCKPTSTERRRRRTAAFTLVEFLISMSLGMIAMAAVGGFSLYTARSFAGISNYSELDRASRNALDVMTRDIRQTIELSAFATNRLDFRDHDDATLSFVYNPQQRTLTRVKGADAVVLLTECDELHFGIFQRNPVGGTYDQYTNSMGAADTKLVQVSWTCSRTIKGAKANTESVQTAKIVIRKK